MNEDAKLLTQALAALVLLVDGDHDKDCRYQNTPINECPTCSGRHTKIAREAIKALTKRVAVYTAAPAPQAQEQIVNMGTPVEKLFVPAPQPAIKQSLTVAEQSAELDAEEIRALITETK